MEKNISLCLSEPEADSRPIRRQPRDAALATREAAAAAAAGPTGLKTEAAGQVARMFGRRILLLDRNMLPNVGGGAKLKDAIR